MLRMRMMMLPLVMMSTTPVAWAADSYLSLKGGLTSPIDLEYDRPISGNAVKTEYSQGMGAFGAIGTKVGTNGRIELEGSYQQADVDKHVVSGFGSAGSIGETSVLAAMMNGYYDLPMNNMVLKPYVGAGIGTAFVNYDGHRTTSVGLLDDTQWAFAYQGMVGLNYALTGQLDLNLEYRYFSTAGIKVELNNADVDFESHNLMVGVNYKF